MAVAPVAFHPGTRPLYSLSSDVVGYRRDVVSGQPLNCFLADRTLRRLECRLPGSRRPRTSLWPPASTGGVTAWCPVRIYVMRSAAPPKTRLGRSSRAPLERRALTTSRSWWPGCAPMKQRRRSTCCGESLIAHGLSRLPWLRPSVLTVRYPSSTSAADRLHSDFRGAKWLTSALAVTLGPSSPVAFLGRRPKREIAYAATQSPGSGSAADPRQPRRQWRPTHLPRGTPPPLSTAMVCCGSEDLRMKSFDERSGESLRAGGSCYDEPYTWGRPASTYLAPRQVARLLVLRSRLQASMSPELASHRTEHAAGA